MLETRGPLPRNRQAGRQAQGLKDGTGPNIPTVAFHAGPEGKEREGGPHSSLTRVNKGLHWVPVNFAVDVEHHHLAKALGSLFHGDRHVLLDVLLPGSKVKKGLSGTGTLT